MSVFKVKAPRADAYLPFAEYKLTCTQGLRLFSSVLFSNFCVFVLTVYLASVSLLDQSIVYPIFEVVLY